MGLRFKAEESVHSKARKHKDLGAFLGTVCSWMWGRTEDRDLKLEAFPENVRRQLPAGPTVVPGETVESVLNV